METVTTILVDPPREGLDDLTCKLLARFNHIVYISCNPETLARDVSALSTTHTVAHLAVFDQFPYTEHLEMGLVLQRAEWDWNQFRGFCKGLRSARSKANQAAQQQDHDTRDRFNVVVA